MRVKPDHLKAQASDRVQVGRAGLPDLDARAGLCDRARPAGRAARTVRTPNPRRSKVGDSVMARLGQAMTAAVSAPAASGTSAR